MAGEGRAGRYNDEAYEFKEYELEERPGAIGGRSVSPVAAAAAAAAAAMGFGPSEAEAAARARREELYTIHDLRKTPAYLQAADALQDVFSDKERQRLKHEAAQEVQVLETRNFINGGLSEEDLQELLIKKTLIEKKPFRRYDAIRKQFNEFLRAYDAALIPPRDPEVLERLRHVRDRVVPKLLSALDLEHQRDTLIPRLRSLNEGAEIIHVAPPALVAEAPAAALAVAPPPAAAEGNGLSADNLAKFDANKRVAGSLYANHPSSWSLFTGQPQLRPLPGSGIRAEYLPPGGGEEARRPSRKQRGGKRKTQKSKSKRSKRSTLKHKRS